MVDSERSKHDPAMHEDPGWLTVEEDATLDEIAKTLRPKTRSEREETARRCAGARRYRLRQESAGADQAEPPAGPQ
jgi:hypothetical protein